jgi:hypothetical protein
VKSCLDVLERAQASARVELCESVDDGCSGRFVGFAGQREQYQGCPRSSQLPAPIYGVGVDPDEHGRAPRRIAQQGEPDEGAVRVVGVEHHRIEGVVRVGSGRDVPLPHDVHRRKSGQSTCREPLCASDPEQRAYRVHARSSSPRRGRGNSRAGRMRAPCARGFPNGHVDGRGRPAGHETDRGSGPCSGPDPAAPPSLRIGAQCRRSPLRAWSRPP